MIRRNIHQAFALVVGLALLAGVAAAQATGRHMRKYKELPPTAHVEVVVLKPNGKPLTNVAVIFHPVKDGKFDGNLEMKTDDDGKAVLDLIPVGSEMNVQVIADGYATFGQEYEVPTDTKSIVITMQRPVEQYSTYRDNGQTAVPAPGVMEPPKATTKPVPPTPGVLPIDPKAKPAPQD
jgi:hypothetical protein